VKGGTAGSTGDYLAAWRRIRRIFDEVEASHSAGGNVFFAYSATGSWALKAKPGGQAGSGDPLYPGDDLIDVFAHDRYNWASCRGDAWEQFSAEWAPLVALAAAHKKPLLAAEFGSPPADGARNDWFRQAADWLRTDPLARKWFWGFAYFHTLHDTCPWDFLNHGDDGRLGWREGFSHPYFTGTPFSLASGHSTPIPQGVTNATPAPTAGTRPLKPVSPKPSTTTTKPSTTTTSTPALAAPAPGTASDPAPASADAAPTPGSEPPDPAALAPTSEAATEHAAPPLHQPLPSQNPTPSSTNSTAVFTGLAAVLAVALVARRLVSA
jgi:hypothetical protein